MGRLRIQGHVPGELCLSPENCVYPIAYIHTDFPLAELDRDEPERGTGC